jgi:arylsulfatase A-like enzyme
VRILLPLTFLLIFQLSALPASPAADEKPARTNILFLFADDQRADTIAALGNPIIKTPNLDRLARSGMAFTRAYMQGGFNGATCVPSRAMLLSGRNLFHIDEKLLRDETWPEAFGRAGYTTFISGKWHNGEASPIRELPVDAVRRRRQRRPPRAGNDLVDPDDERLSGLRPANGDRPGESVTVVSG